jgi:hypothetical protein
MDSYETIRKMGEISKQLKKHGLAEDSLQAQKEAEKIMTPQNSQIYVSKDKVDMMQKEASENSSDENSEKSNVCGTVVNQIKDQLGRFENRVSNVEANTAILRDKMNEIIAKLNELESKLIACNKQEVQATLVTKKHSSNNLNSNQSKSEEKSISSNTEKNNNSVVPEVKKEYNSNDVSVDKMFYFGKK